MALDTQRIDDLTEKILESMKIIADGQINNLAYDRTISCIIESNENAKKGEYIVTDGSSSFVAYSQNTDYLVGASVYVTIPQSDFSNQKYITGKCLSADGVTEPYIYVDPLKSYVDITGDLINDDSKKGLVANGDITYILLYDGSSDTDFFNLSNKTYNRVGLKAEFQSLLKTANTIDGHYGIELIIEHKKNPNIEVPETAIFMMDCNDFTGDPYAFDVFVSQQMTFDISQLGEITRLRVVFYQDKDSFYNQNDQLIEPASTNNLFCKNCFVSFGYNLEDFSDNNTIILYSSNGLTYNDNPNSDTYIQRNKNLKMSWIQRTDNKAYSISNSSDKPEEAIIHWYKYLLGDNIIDSIAGPFWVELTEAKNSFSYTAIPDNNVANEKYKIIIEYFSKEYIYSKILFPNAENLDLLTEGFPSNYTEFNNAVEKNNKYKDYINDDLRQLYEQALRYSDNPEAQQLIIDQFDTIMSEALQLYNTFESEILILENENPVVDYSAVSLIQGLEIICEGDYVEYTGEFNPHQVFYTYDEKNAKYNTCIGLTEFANGVKYYVLKSQGGVYNLYDISDELLDRSQSLVLRRLDAQYTTLITGETALDTADEITWKIPLSNTMIQEPREGTEYVTEKSGIKLNNILVSTDEYNCYITRFKEYQPDLTPGSIEVSRTSQFFRIKDHYNPNANNNTIECIVSKNGKEYRASFDLQFGPNGSNGTDYTFTLEMEGLERVLTKDNDKKIKIIPRLYDAESKEIDLTNTGVQIEYSWYCKEDEYVFTELSEAEIANWPEGIAYFISVEDIGNPPHYNIKGTKSEYDILVANNINKDIKVAKISKSSRNNVSKIILCKNQDAIDESITTLQATALDEVYIRLNSSEDINSEIIKQPHCYILQAKIPQKVESLSGNIVDLVALLPIPYRTSEKIYSFSGTTKIIYNSFGNSAPTFFNAPCNLYDEKGKILPNVQWKVNTIDSLTESNLNKANKILNYYPKFSEKEPSQISPASIYYKDNSPTVYIEATVTIDDKIEYWYQPLLISQNPYGSSLLNKWDGTSFQLDNENGTILSSMLGAGEKDKENRFNGILIGDVELKAGFNNQKIGLYGFSEGEASYGFLIDGTAFIGKHGKGQILFDGDQGLIQSRNFNNNTGSRWDLDEGVFTVYNPNGDGAYVELNGGNKDKPYFVINNGNQTLINIGKNDYYLRSGNYTQNSDGTGSGTNFNLEDGTLNSYHFKLTAISESDKKNAIVIDSTAEAKVPFRIGPSHNSKNFCVNWDGSVNATHGKIGDWVLDEKGIHLGSWEEFKIKINNNTEEVSIRLPKLYLGMEPISSKVCGHYEDKWLLLINRNFGVTSGGRLFCESATLKGTIIAQDGDIGGWTITSKGLELIGNGTEDSPQLYLGRFGVDGGVWNGKTRNFVFKAGKNFGVTSSGVLYAKEAYIEGRGTFEGTITAHDGEFTGKVTATSGTFNGEINAEKGNIGGWKIEPKRISSGSNYISSSDGIKMGPSTLKGDRFVVGDTSSKNYISYSNGTLRIRGDLEATNATFTGTVNATSGNIGSWKINPSGLFYSNSMFLSPTNGIKMNSNFIVTPNGSLTALAGTIGGFEIAPGRFGTDSRKPNSSRNACTIYSNDSGYYIGFIEAGTTVPKPFLTNDGERQKTVLTITDESGLVVMALTNKGNIISVGNIYSGYDKIVDYSGEE